MLSKSRISEPVIPYGQMNFIFTVRSLWRNLATWTRAYLVNQAAGFGSGDIIFNRLYRIPQEFGNIMQYIFGYDNAQKYTQFLSQQLVYIRELIDAEIAGDIDLVNQKVQQLYQLADERSTFVSSINPFWDETEARNLMYTYIQLNIEQITTLLTKDYERNIDIFDRLLHHTDSMGSFFAEGLLNYLTFGQQYKTIQQPQNAV